MPAPNNVYVFLSLDRTTFGLTVDWNGANLPGARWTNYDVIPMSMNYFARYSDDPGQVARELLSKGYSLVRTRGNIIPFPTKPPRAS